MTNDTHGIQPVHSMSFQLPQESAIATLCRLLRDPKEDWRADRAEKDILVHQKTGLLIWFNDVYRPCSISPGIIGRIRIALAARVCRRNIVANLLKKEAA